MASVQTKPLATEIRPLDWFKTDERELARHDDPEKVRLQGEDMLAKGQLQPVGATEDGRMIFGHGRFRAAKSAGIKTLEVKVFPASISDTQFKLIRAAENLHRKELTVHQKSLLCSELIEANPTWQLKDLAEQLHLDPSMVTRLLSPAKCIPAWQEALAAGKVGISEVYEASKLGEAEQAELLRLKLSGASRDAIVQAGRKSRSTKPTSIKLSRVKIAMPQGASVVVSGNELSMSELVELLSDTLKEARRAAEQFDIRTFQSMMRDKAKAR